MKQSVNLFGNTAFMVQGRSQSFGWGRVFAFRFVYALKFNVGIAGHDKIIDTVGMAYLFGCVRAEPLRETG